MLESIRSRLLLWYTLVLTLLIAIYAGAVTIAYRQSLLMDVDSGLVTVARVVNQSLLPDPSGAFDVNFPPDFRETVFGVETDTYFIVWNARGGVVDRSEDAPDDPPRPEPGVVTTRDARELVLDGPANSRVMVGRRLTEVNAAVRSLGVTIAAVASVILLLSFAGGWFLAGRALAPIARISGTAGAMAGGDLSARIPVEDTDSELEQVARALNSAFDRLQSTLERERQFTADASHEFRTPLAIMRTEFEWALKRERTPEEYRSAIATAQQVVQRLTDVSDRLLTLARGRHGAGGGASPQDLQAVLGEAVSLLHPLAAEAGVALTAAVERMDVNGDRALLIDAFSNVVANAIRYNRADGRVAVQARRDGQHAQVVITDSGIGIDGADLPHIFERFYRADRSRGRDSGGAGLGLAIAKEIVVAHGGTITCVSEPGAGSAFTIRLPLAGA